ncbi:MAG: hypothetical protein QOG44_29 [Acidimicrobiaceae bacterium]|nr:hypothetical protein [Acidimicrobiaceae bacterium]
MAHVMVLAPSGVPEGLFLPGRYGRPVRPGVRPGRGPGRHALVSARAELSSVATAIDELAHRVAAIGEGLTGAERDSLRADLFEVERALGNASRRLSRALDDR